MHRHAYAKRAELGLTPEEALETRVRVYSNFGVASIGVVSILIAVFLAATSLVMLVSMLAGERRSRLNSRLRDLSGQGGPAAPEVMTKPTEPFRIVKTRPKYVSSPSSSVVTL